MYIFIYCWSIYIYICAINESNFTHFGCRSSRRHLNESLSGANWTAPRLFTRFASFFSLLSGEGWIFSVNLACFSCWRSDIFCLSPFDFHSFPKYLSLLLRLWNKLNFRQIWSLLVPLSTFRWLKLHILYNCTYIMLLYNCTHMILIAF